MSESSWARRARERVAGRADKTNDKAAPPGGTSDVANEPSSERPWPDPPAPEAFTGLAGEIVHAIEPQSEADPTALLAQVLVAFGNAAGRIAHFCVESDRHYPNLFAILVGETAKGRKGTSWGRIRALFLETERQWCESRILTGLSSAEGLIWNVRDPIIGREKIKQGGRVTGMQEYEADPGEPDKRMWVHEPEFTYVLKQFERTGNTLSPIIRQAWETGNLRTLTKNSPARATGAHVSIIGHTTAEELRRYLSTTEAASGFGNRFLWLCVRRSKCLPDGGQYVNLEPFVARLTDALDCARRTGELQRDERAREIWHGVYPQLSAGRPGLTGALLGRAEAQTMRLAAVYALLDCSEMIRADHLAAALALWEYCERSTRYVFGDALGDEVADEILGALRRNPEGLTRTVIRDMFNRHRTERVARALGVLAQHGLARSRSEVTGGRPVERWIPVNGSR